jgi:hypothetical protein
MTFRACSSPAPTRVKPQPAPAILSQESVHTTLSITHHTRKRPSTGPRTTHGPHGFNKDSRFVKHSDIADIYNQFLERADQGEEYDDEEEIAAAEIVWGQRVINSKSEVD